MRLRIVSGLLVLVAITTRCASPTEIVVDVYTEVECAKGPKATFKAGATLGELRSKAATSELVACAPRSERSGRIVLSPSGERDEAVAFQVMTRNDAQDPEQTCTEPSYAGCIVARRQLRFSPGASTRVEVALRLACLDKPCEPTETCRNGTCVSAVVPESCIGADCTDPSVDAPASGPADAAALEDAGADAGPSEEVLVPLKIDEVAPAPVYVLPGGEIRGLSVVDGGLVWLEVAPGVGVRVRRGTWENLAAAAANAVPDGHGVHADPTGAEVVTDVASGAGQLRCAFHVGAGNVSCADLLVSPYGVARGTSPARIFVGGIAPGGNGAIAWFTPLQPALEGSCSTGVVVDIRYMEVAGGGLFFAAGDGVRKMSLTPGPDCSDGLVLALTGAVGLAATDGEICAGSPAGIRCLSQPGSTKPVEPRPSGDLAFRRVGAQLLLYYASNEQIRVMRIQ